VRTPQRNRNKLNEMTVAKRAGNACHEKNH